MSNITHQHRLGERPLVQDLTTEEIIALATKGPIITARTDGSTYEDNHLELSKTDETLEYWTIKREVSTWVDRCVFNVKTDVDKIARAISAYFPDQEVTVEAFSRIRRCYLGGEISEDNTKSLSDYYTGISPEQDNGWRALCPMPEE